MSTKLIFLCFLSAILAGTSRAVDEVAFKKAAKAHSKSLKNSDIQPKSKFSSNFNKKDYLKNLAKKAKKNGKLLNKVPHHKFQTKDHGELWGIVKEYDDNICQSKNEVYRAAYLMDEECNLEEDFTDFGDSSVYTKEHCDEATGLPYVCIYDSDNCAYDYTTTQCWYYNDCEYDDEEGITQSFQCKYSTAQEVMGMKYSGKLVYEHYNTESEAWQGAYPEIIERWEDDVIFGDDEDEDEDAEFMKDHDDDDDDWEGWVRYLGTPGDKVCKKFTYTDERGNDKKGYFKSVCKPGKHKIELWYYPSWKKCKGGTKKRALFNDILFDAGHEFFAPGEVEDDEYGDMTWGRSFCYYSKKQMIGM